MSKGPPTTPKASKVTVRHADGTTEVVANGHFLKQPYWRSKRWCQKRRAVMVRDSNRCVVCKRRSGDTDPRLKAGQVVLEVHHLTYERFGHEKLSDLVTLCQRCHATEHQWQSRRAA